MKLVPFAGCCTARILTGFGQTFTAEHQYRPEQPYTEKTMFQELLSHLETAGRNNVATVISITNSDQTIAATVLPRAGFVEVQKELAKRQHADKTISTWVYTVTDKNRVPLPLPDHNPFAKKPNVPAPAQVPEVAQGVLDHVILHNNTMLELFVGEEALDIVEWFDAEHRWNQQLRANNLRGPNGRYCKLPTPGKMYTLDKLEKFFIPRGMVYRLVTRSQYFQRGVHSSYRRCPTNRYGIAFREAANRNVIGISFA